MISPIENTSYITYEGNHVKKKPPFITRFFGSKDVSLIDGTIKIIHSLFKKYILNADIKITSPWKKKIHALSVEKVISKEFLVYGCINAAIHKSDKEWAECAKVEIISPEKIGLEEDRLFNMELKDHCFFDPKSGLKVGVFIKNDHIVIAYGAVESHVSETPSNLKETAKKAFNKRLKHQGITNSAMNLIGATPKVYHQARDFTELLLEKLKVLYPQKEFRLTGHCFGGSIAEYLALLFEEKAVCTNSLPIGAGLQKEIPPNRLANADKYVEHVINAGDIIVDCKLFLISWIAKAIDFLFTRIVSIRTPGNFGKIYRVPRKRSMFSSVFIGPKEARRIHKHILRDMIKYIDNDNLKENVVFQSIKERAYRYKMHGKNLILKYKHFSLNRISFPLQIKIRRVAK